MAAPIENKSPSFWRVTCHVGQNPGQWSYWYREQCCAIGWAPPEFSLTGSSTDKGWVGARNAVLKMRAGDRIVATLPGHRIGRIGIIVDVRVEDDQWDPIVPPDYSRPMGDNGRRILVRWDLAVGPPEVNRVVLLPEVVRIPPQLLRRTVQELPQHLYEKIVGAMKDETNWTSIIGSFSIERALSDYIAIYPERLEAGMISHPSINAREYAFQDRTRADVILEDRDRNTVIVECKQGSPSSEAILQVMGYRDQLAALQPQLGTLRAMLVHGGSTRVSSALASEAKMHGVELVYHELNVSFVNSMA